MAKEEKVKAQDTPETQDTPVTVDIEAIIKAAKEAAKAELKAEMQAEKKAAGKVESVPMTEEEIKYWDELVEYSAPFIEGDDGEITVGHNGKLYKIRRGETVKIPRKVRQVILDSEKQKMAFAKLKKGLANQELQA